MKGRVSVTSRELASVGTDGVEDESGGFDESGFAGSDAGQIYDDMNVVMAGMIAGKKNLITKNNKMMAFLDLEDMYGITEVVVFPKVYDRYRNNVNEDTVVFIIEDRKSVV